MTTPTDLLARQLSRDGSRPLLTFYDDAAGARVELSVATTANWVAKTANYLIDEHAVDAGDVVGVRLPVHWQAAVIVLAAWATGAQVAFDGAPAVVTFASDGSAAAGDVVALSLDPMGADFSRLVAAQPDAFTALLPSGGDVVEAAPVDVPHAARVLSTLPYDSADAIGYALVGPLATDGSVVLVRNPEPIKLAEHAAVERVTHTVGVDVDALPRLSSAR